ncbi:MAG: single-stranded-DNA-specific exonuclease RecJ [Spirulinaceae cyanobacterium]
MTRLPNQRWQIASPPPEQVSLLIQATGLPSLLAKVVINRSIKTPEQAEIYLDPESQTLPPPIDEFADLGVSVDLISEAIAEGRKIAICGDYDADGMTSTALLWRALGHLGAEVSYAIPSRMKDGYGINNRIVEEFAKEGVELILTVDNGISAVEPIARAVELGLSVIITDHHDLPPELPEADAILNPKLLPKSSPYYGLAGVGVAYILAITTAQEMGQLKGLTNQLLELFTLGTIADLAPLVGVNRRWLKRGLRMLPKSQLAGVQALIQVSGVSEEQKALQPDDIGFRLGPRINAVGRLADPQIVIDLLTTNDQGIALERAMQCEQINRQRQTLCEEIEQQAIASLKQRKEDWYKKRVLVVVQPGWHHGVIGIVASRLVERYGVPVFIGTYEEDDDSRIRGSARGIPEFNIFEALQHCQPLLGKFGGHKAAGGFGLPAENLKDFETKLAEFAQQSLEPDHLKPLVKIDAETHLREINAYLYKQIDSLQPWGIQNPAPIFWTANVRVLEQERVGKGKGHLKLVLGEDASKSAPTSIKAIAWRWGEYFPVPSRVDVAYKLKENHWNGKTNVELEIVGIRLPSSTTSQAITQTTATQKAQFSYKGRFYSCSLWESLNELRIKNPQGKVLAVSKGKTIALIGTTRDDAQEVDVGKNSPYYSVIKAAVAALAKQNPVSNDQQ